jgi:parallel beta-helix repeat protein
VDSILSLGNLITENKIFNNSLEGIKLTNGANNALPAPSIDNATNNPYQITGTACTGCTVEVFQNPDDDGEGKFFVGVATADATTGSFTLQAFITNPYLTATASDAGDGTSEFSASFEVPFRTIVLPLTLR